MKQVDIKDWVRKNTSPEGKEQIIQVLEAALSGAPVPPSLPRDEQPEEAPVEITDPSTDIPPITDPDVLNSIEFLRSKGMPENQLARIRTKEDVLRTIEEAKAARTKKGKINEQ